MALKNRSIGRWGWSLLLFLSILVGCSRVEYDIAIINQTGEEIDGATVDFGDFKSGGGVIVNGGMKKASRFRYPLKERAQVKWVSPDGKRHAKDVEVAKLVPRSFAGIIFFKILPDEQVQVVAITDQDYYHGGKNP